MNSPISEESSASKNPDQESKKPSSSIFEPLRVLLSGEFAREGYLSALDQGLISLTNFLAAILLARRVSPTEFGVYAVGFLLLHLARAIMDGLVIQPLNSIGAVMDQPSFRRYVSSAGILLIALALAMSITAAVGGWFLISTGNDVAGPTLFALWFVFLTWPIQEYIRRAFYTRGAIPRAVVTTSISSLIRLIALVILMSSGELKGVVGLYAIGWGALAGGLFGFLIALPYWTTKFDSPIRTGLQNWRFGRWVLGGTVASWVVMEVYPILAAGLISFAAAGAYRALQTVVAPIHVLLRALDTLLTPRAARRFHVAGHKGLSRILRLTYAIAGLPILGVLLLAIFVPKTILQILYGDIYLPFSDGLILMSIYYAVWFIYWPLQAAYKAIRLTRPIFVANAVAIVMMFTLGVWMIGRWGLNGTIAGQALNALVVAVGLWVQWIWLRRRPQAELAEESA